MSPPHILLVDDDQDILDTLGRLLSVLGLRVTTRAESADALVLATRDEDIDVVLTDWHMPGLSGLDLAARLVAARPGLPVIVTTGSPEALPEHLRKSGVHVVAKPVRAPALAEKLRRLTQRIP